jgi:Tol biopolymer transport system component
MDEQPSWSPDGGKIVFVSNRDVYEHYGDREVYVMNADGSGQTNLTSRPGIDQGPAWSPDGSRIVFTSSRDGNFEIYVMNADGSGGTRRTTNAAEDQAPDWQPLLRGDVNCGGGVNSIDALLILQFSSGLLPRLMCEGLADVNSDGQITAIDALLVLQFAAGLLPSLPP